MEAVSMDSPSDMLSELIGLDDSPALFAFLSTLVQAGQHKTFKYIMMLLKLTYDEDVLKLTDEYGNTFLHYACQGGNTSIVEYLLPSFDMNCQGQNECTPVMHAAYSGRKEVFDLLVTKGADLTLNTNDGDTVLHRACQGGNASIVEHLLPSFDINSRGYNGWTPVMNAAYSDKKEVFDLLVTKGADIKVTNSDDNTVFHLACEGGNTSIVEHLLPSFDINSRGCNGWTPVMNAAYSGKKEVFDLLVTKGADLTLNTNDGDTVLHRACQGGNISIVEHLVPSFDINSRGYNGWTPVMNAATSGKKEVFDLLVIKEADITLTNNNGNTIFHLACQLGNTSIVEYLLPSFDINSRGYNGWTPIMNAANSGNNDVFDLLVTKGADMKVTNNNNNTVFHLACEGGNTCIVNQLLSSFDINSRGYKGWTPVMNAVNSGKKDVFDLLVTKGADIKMTNNDGNTVFHLACKTGNISIVKQLLPSFDINSRGYNGLTAVMNAAFSGKKEVFDLLVTKGADLKLTGNHGDTILHFACQGGNESIVKLTLPLFTVNVRGNWAHTPLMSSAACGHVGIFNLLLQYGADTSLVDEGGDTILHLACEGGHLDRVKLVLPFSDINMKNNSGWTPLMAALVYGKSKVYQYLVDEGADRTVVDKAGEDVLTLARRGGCSDVIKEISPADQEIHEIGKWTELMQVLVFGIFYLEKYEIGSSELIQRDGFGDTLLHLACRGGNKRCVEHLLPCYDINVRGRYGWTPLMMAARCGHLDVFQYLVSHQADLSLVSDTGEEILTLAQRGEHGDIVTYLLTIPVL